MKSHLQGPEQNTGKHGNEEAVGVRSIGGEANYWTLQVRSQKKKTLR
jgi:hypothetical protein